MKLHGGPNLAPGPEFDTHDVRDYMMKFYVMIPKLFAKLDILGGIEVVDI